MSRIGLVDLAVAYNGRRVVDGVSMHIEPRTWVALIGPNGAEVDPARAASANLVPYVSEIDIGGVPTAQMTRRQLSELVAFLPQRPVMPEGVTVADYVAIGRPHMSPTGVPSRGTIARIIAAVLEETGADDAVGSSHRHVVRGGAACRSRTSIDPAIRDPAPRRADVRARRGPSAAGPGADRRAPDPSAD